MAFLLVPAAAATARGFAVLASSAQASRGSAPAIAGSRSVCLGTCSLHLRCPSPCAKEAIALPLSSFSSFAKDGSNATLVLRSRGQRGASLSAGSVACTRRAAVPRAQAATADAQVLDSPDRFRLNNLSPQPGARRKNKRKGRGYGAGQGGSCGFGMRGQKSRSGPKVRPGFEGGQMPLYRRLPKLKGIAGGMGAGLPKFVNVNVNDISSLGLPEDTEIGRENLIDLGIINPTGRDRKLPLKILGDGEISTKLTIRAAAFSASAKEKLEAAGCTLVVEPGRKKFLGAAAAKRLERAVEFYAAKASST